MSLSMRIRIAVNGPWLADEVIVCRTFFARLRGWLGRPAPAGGQALYLSPCRGVHMLGMKFSLDAVYVNSAGQVLRIVTLRPNQVGPWVGSARGVLELAAGRCQTLGLKLGDRLIWEGEGTW